MLLSLRTGDSIFKNRGICQKIQVYSNSKTRKLSTYLICPLHFSIEIDTQHSNKYFYLDWWMQNGEPSYVCFYAFLDRTSKAHVQDHAMLLIPRTKGGLSIKSKNERRIFTS